VYAFEADPTTFKALEKNINLNNCTNVVLFNKGIGDKPGFIQIKNKKNPFGNKGGTMWEYSGNSGITGNDGNTTEVITIDSLNLEKLNFMKLDVEGMEDKVFTGMKDTIIKLKPIILYESWENLKDKSTEVLLSIHKYDIKKVSSHDYIAIP
jgi:FkbM family methyltransferase